MKIPIPPSILINTIVTPCVCHFKDKRHRPEGPPHFYVIIPVNAATDLVLTMITSQIASTTAYYSNNPDAYASLVAAGKSDLPFLPVDPSLINCNNVELVAKVELLKRCAPAHGFEMKTPTVPDKLKDRIITAINNSPVVKPIIKKLLAGL